MPAISDTASSPSPPSSPPPSSVEVALDRRRMNLVFVTVMGGMLLAALDQTIVSTALPTIVGDLGGAEHLSWVVSAYLLTDTIATVIAGKFGDLFGRKLVFQASALVFIVASAACGFAQSMSDRLRRLELAIARLSRRASRDDLAALWREADTRLAVADAWCLAQVHVRAELQIPPTLPDIARRVRVPQEVLAPAFAAALHRGYLVEDGATLRLTESGRHEISQLVHARRAWLARELSDWGAEDDLLLNEALDNLARRMLEESPELEPV